MMPSPSERRQVEWWSRVTPRISFTQQAPAEWMTTAGGIQLRYARSSCWATMPLVKIAVNGSRKLTPDGNSKLMR
jgi:hypothetical protein